MIKKLSAIGSSLGLVIEKPILELLKIDRDTDLEITTDGDGLHIRPVRAHDPELEKSMSKLHKKYGKTLKNLA